MKFIMLLPLLLAATSTATENSPNLLDALDRELEKVTDNVAQRDSLLRRRVLNVVNSSSFNHSYEVPVYGEFHVSEWLRGRTLTVTVVEDDGPDGVFARTRSGSGNPLNESKYSGFVVDVLRELRGRAGFTLKMPAPSEQGSQCEDCDTCATSYLCGEDDVLELSVSDVFAGMYYITKER